MPLDFVSSEFGLTWVLAQGTPATLQGDAGSFDWLDVISRIVHILAAITLAGGTFYQCAMVAPTADTLQGTEPRRTRSTPETLSNTVSPPRIDPPVTSPSHDNPIDDGFRSTGQLRRAR